MKTDRNLLEKAYEDLLALNKSPNYFDVQGYTLLQYAAALGDSDKVQSCLTQGADPNYICVRWFEAPEESPIALALRKGDANVAELLYQRGARINHIHLDVCSNQATRSWFEAKIMATHQYVFDNKEDTTGGNIHPVSPLERAVEVGDIEFVKQSLSGIKKDKLQAALDSILVTAARNGKLDLVKFALDSGARINPLKSFEKSAIGEAAKHGYDEILAYLLSIKGADATHLDDRKCTPLMHAVASGHQSIVRLLLAHGLDALSLQGKDIQDETVLHYCARCKDPRINQQILSLPGAQELLNSSNVYGHTPFDIAVREKNIDFIKTAYPEKPIEAVEKLPEYGQPLSQVGHHTLITRWEYYFNQQGRDNSFFRFVGKCNGFGYLHEFYASRNMESYFFNTLELISAWDGSQEALEKPLGDIEQGKYYKNLGELFDQWINDVIFLQQSNLKEIYEGTSQRDREGHMQLLGKDPDDAHVSLYTSPEGKKSPDKASEFLKYILRMPSNVRFEIRSGQHDTSGHILDDHQVSYYDPNHVYRAMSVSSSDELVERMLNFQYIWPRAMLDQQDAINFDISVFCFGREIEQIRSNEFHVFSEDEIPKSSEEASLFRQRSPNKFTPIHIAVITRCVLDLERLLKDNFYELNATDSYGRMALQIAESNHFDEGIILIASAFPPVKKMGYLRTLMSNGRNDLVDEVLKRTDVNKPDELGCSLLYYAVKYRNAMLVEEFLKRGADVNEKNGRNDSLIDLLESTYNLDPENHATLYKLILPNYQMSQADEAALPKALFFAVSVSDNELFKQLVKKCDNNVFTAHLDKGLNVLHLAILKKDVDKINILLNTDINIDAKTASGNTALMALLQVAASSKDAFKKEEFHHLVSEFLKRNPDLTIANNAGKTVLNLVAESRDAALELMFKQHQSVTKVDQNIGHNYHKKNI